MDSLPIWFLTVRLMSGMPDVVVADSLTGDECAKRLYVWADHAKAYAKRNKIPQTWHAACSAPYIAPRIERL